MTDKRLAELFALDDFAWIVDAPTSDEKIIADTYAEYAGEIEALRADAAGPLDPARVTFHMPEDGSAWAWTDLRSDARRSEP